jgi:hypothetical protein
VAGSKIRKVRDQKSPGRRVLFETKHQFDGIWVAGDRDAREMAMAIVIVSVVLAPRGLLVI